MQRAAAVDPTWTVRLCVLQGASVRGGATESGRAVLRGCCRERLASPSAVGVSGEGHNARMMGREA